jgi:hypothetical protein
MPGPGCKTQTALQKNREDGRTLPTYQEDGRALQRNQKDGRTLQRNQEDGRTLQTNQEGWGGTTCTALTAASSLVAASANLGYVNDFHHNKKAAFSLAGLGVDTTKPFFLPKATD